MLSTCALDDSKSSGFRNIDEDELAALRAGEDERRTRLRTVGANVGGA